MVRMIRDDIAFYSLWGDDYQRLRDEKNFLNRFYSADDYKANVYDIEHNNIYFLEELEKEILKGGKSAIEWLKVLIKSYTVRCNDEFGPHNEIEYYKDWINNTLWIIGEKYPMVKLWCNDYLQQIINSKEEMKDVSDKTFKDSTAGAIASDVIPQEVGEQQSEFTGFVKTAFYLRLKHDNRPALMSVLRTLLEGKRGKDVAMVIMALEYKGFLVVPSRGLNNIIKEMTLDFGNIGSPAGIYDHYQTTTKRSFKLISQSDIDNICDFFP